MSKIVELFANIIAPPRCVGCDELLPIARLTDCVVPFCKTCFERYQDQKQTVCNRCQKPVADCLCASETMRRNGLTTLLKLNYYNDKQDAVQDKILFQIKKYPDRRLFAFCANELNARLTAYLKEQQLDKTACVLCYLPRSKKAILEHGFDQSERMVRRLSKLSAITFFDVVQRKKGQNVEQKTLTVTGRKENAKKSYYLDKKYIKALQDKTVFLLDDMVTTGAGMTVVGKALLHNGVKAVVGIALSESSYNRDFHEKGN